MKSIAIYISAVLTAIAGIIMVAMGFSESNDILIVVHSFWWIGFAIIFASIIIILKTLDRDKEK